MGIRSALPPDDLLLAESLLRQFARRLQGITSVGLSVCFSRICDPKGFLGERLEDLRGFLNVFRAVTRGQEELRRQAAQLEERFTQLVNAFEVMSRQIDLTAPELQRAADDFGNVFRALFEVLQQTATALGMESKFCEERDFGQRMVVGLIAGMPNGTTSNPLARAPDTAPMPS